MATKIVAADAGLNGTTPALGSTAAGRSTVRRPPVKTLCTNCDVIADPP